MKKIERVLFIGSKQLGLDCLKTMVAVSKETLIGVMTFNDSTDTRSRFNAFKEYCSKAGVPLLIARNRADSEKIIEDQNPDICIAVGWYWLISNRILDKIPNGILGIHNSFLPKYRGGSPLIWAIINGESKVGFSMFTFNEGMDEGDIWFQYEFDIKHEHNINNILEEMGKHAVIQLKKNYPDILSGQLKPVPQNHKEATYCAQRKPEDGLIDWHKSAKDIYNFIRAQSKPYPGAFTIYKNKKLTIWAARLNECTYYGTPGQVARINHDGVLIICGDNKSILLTEIEYEQKEIKSNKLIKTINTRFTSSSPQTDEFNSWLEHPETAHKIQEYIEWYMIAQKHQMFTDVQLPKIEKT